MEHCEPNTNEDLPGEPPSYFSVRRGLALGAGVPIPMRLFRIISILFLLNTTFSLAQDGPAPIELVLKFDPIAGQAISGNMAPYNGGSFYLVISHGEVFLAESASPKADTEKTKGSAQFIHRNGIDPATRTFPPPIFELRFRSSNSGWAADKFITEIVVSYSFQRRGGKDVVVFSDKATEVKLWEKFQQGSVSFIGDVMDVRYERRLACKEVSSKLNFVPR